MQKFPISLVIITLNEEKAIERCIRSAPFVDEVIVVDSGSRDRTVQIAEQLGARVVHEPWRGYAKQKIFATSLARHQWVLSLDADEALSPNLQAEIQGLLSVAGSVSDPVQTANSTLNRFDAYMMPRMTWHLGRWLKHGGMYPDYQTRLFNKERARWLDTHVHEKVVAQNVSRLREPILHWSFDNIAHQIETINKYSGLRAQDFMAKGKRFATYKMIGKMLSKFFECYILKQGFRDGRAGLIIAVVSSFATFLRWAKLYELQSVVNKDTKNP